MNRFKTRVCLGISIEPETIKLVVLGTKDLESPWPLELRSFPDLASFEEYWLDRLESQYGVDLVGVTFYEPGDLGALTWLEGQDIKMEYFVVPTLTFYGQTLQHKVPGPFEAAYDQALACLIRTRAAEFTLLIAEQAKRIDQDLSALRCQVDCLQAALSRDPHCPF
jgi:hypothetical protein